MDPLILRLSRFEFLIVAAINGAAVGAGMSLALASDIIIAADNAYFLPSFARLGLVPDAGITFHLARRIGAGRSLSSLMLEEKIDAKTALESGLIYSVVPASELLARAQAIAHRLATGPCAVLGQIRTLHTSTFDNSLQEQLRAERSAQEMTLETQDCVEGVGAFLRNASLIFPNTRSLAAGRSRGAWLRGDRDTNRGERRAIVEWLRQRVSRHPQ